MTKHFIAIDLGATSGRVMLATLSDGGIDLETVTRFRTPLGFKDEQYYWDILMMMEPIADALVKIGEKGLDITSIGVDSWGVDFLRIRPDGHFAANPRSYRDPYTDGIPEKFFREFPREELFRRTGIQIMNFNSVFQLYAQKAENPPETERILFIPDAFGYFLSGNYVTESTILSTSGLADAKTGLPDPEICAVAGVKPEVFGKIVEPGYQLGFLQERIYEESGLAWTPVISVAGHDTASAVAAVPATDPHFAYLSSGTWSLMGIEVPSPIINEDSARENFTNERGIEGTTRFLKNITGMWLLERCKAVWDHEGKIYSYQDLQEMALREKDFPGRINPDDPRFAHPADMVAEISAALSCPLGSLSEAQIVSCIYHSLADRYAEVLEILRGFAPFPIERLHIIGGGSANDLLNQWTADAIGIPVLAGPMEATVLGNVMVQAKAAGVVQDRWEMRSLIAKAFPVKKFIPKK